MMKIKKLVIGASERENKNKVKTKAWYINQCGYDIDKTKRATFVNGERGTIFSVKKVDNDDVVYTGSIYNQVADFTNFKIAGHYYLEADGVVSYDFKIEEDRILNTSLPNALLFFEMSRQDAFDSGGNSGYAWRDSHQFSFEMNHLVMLYMSNPKYFEALPYNMYKLSGCEYPELRVQNEPNIVWLMKFAATRYYKWATEKNIVLHALIKEQLAYFLYVYPHISKYVTEEFYTTIRDFTISVWGVENTTKAWYEETPTHNLFETEYTIGTVKGANPPGHSIVPNLMMYEVLKRDGIDGYQNHFNSAFNTCSWIVNDVDLDLPKTTKGQRMNEHIVVTSLAYFCEMYPDECPAGLKDKLERLADVVISRSNNLWDYKVYRSADDITAETYTTWVNDYTGSGGLGNQPGNTAGVLAVCYSLSRVINDELKIKRLKEIGLCNLDHIAGRNPYGRHYCFTAVDEFDGVKKGWIKRYPGGLGNLEYCIGVLDGSCKEGVYPYNPDESLVGYVEGWVTFNGAWNMSLSYLMADSMGNGIEIFAKK